jgi:hypothetical protein
MAVNKENSEKIKSIRFNFVDIGLSIITLIIALYSFYDYGSKLHFFPIIFGLGGISNFLIACKFFKVKNAFVGIIFFIASVTLLSLAIILAVNIYL